MLNKIRYALTTATLRQSTITVISTILNGGLAAIFYLLVARVLGPTDYGLFALIIATAAIMTVVFDFGFDRGMVKFISSYQSHPQKMQQVLKTSLLTKLASSVVIIIICTFFSQPIAKLVFNQPLMAKFLPLTAIAFSSQLLFYFVTYYFQAREQFVWWGLAFVYANFTRLILAVFVIALGRLDTTTAALLFIATPLFSFIIGMKKIGLNFLNVKIDKQVFWEMFSFNKWVIGFSTVSTISSRLDTYLTSYLLRLSDVGVYGLANQAVIIMPNLVSALGAVTSPKFSRFAKPEHNRNYLRKSILFFSLISFVTLVFLIPVGISFMLISGKEYLSGLLPFLVILLSQGLFMAVTPIRDSILYFFTKPKFFFWAGLIHGSITLLSGIFLIPRLGLLGAGLSNLFGQIFLSLASVIYYYQLSRHE
jgi:O-antigen/teichoic acid export membrane protein